MSLDVQELFLGLKSESERCDGVFRSVDWKRDQFLVLSDISREREFKREFKRESNVEKVISREGSRR